MAVPRVWEKMEEKIREVGAANTGIKKRLGDWAKDLGFRAQHSRYACTTEPPPPPRVCR
jgi:long-subunit acyl-CoA synthetase (AMP-forming)